MTSVSVRDPVDGIAVTFIGDDADVVADGFQDVSRHHGLTIAEVYRMVRVALFGVDALDDDFDPLHEFEKRQDDSERDGALLSLPLPIDEALAIWRRAHDGLRWLLENERNPTRRARLTAVLEEREATMRRLLMRRRLAE